MKPKIDYSSEELQEALAFSEALDGLLLARRRGAAPSEAPGDAPQLAELWPVLRGLTALEEAWGPAPPSLERAVRQKLDPPQREPLWRLFLQPAAALALVALLGLFLTGPGHQAMAELRAILHIGTVQVEVAPEGTTPPTTAVQAYRGVVEQEVPSVEAARQMVSYPLLEPGYLPEGYQLRRVQAISLEEGPTWLREPFFVEMYFAPDDASPDFIYLSLRQSGVNPGPGWEISSLLFRSKDVENAEMVTLDGKQAALLTLEGEFKAKPTSPRVRRPPALRELVWQEGSVMVELGTQVLETEELLRVARSLQ